MVLGFEFCSVIVVLMICNDQVILVYVGDCWVI